MRFKKRLSAAILAIAMIVLSIQIPGETTYAAQIAGSNVESVQDASMLAAEETESVKVPGGGKTNRRKTRRQMMAPVRRVAAIIRRKMTFWQAMIPRRAVIIWQGMMT